MDEEEKGKEHCIQNRLRSIILDNFYIRFIFLLLILIILFFIAQCLGYEIFLNTELLKLLVSIEATMLGFYGLMFTYMLNALDTRQNRYEDHQSIIERAANERAVNELALGLRHGLGIKYAEHDPKEQERMQELDELKEKRLREQGVPDEKRVSAQIDHFKKSKKDIRKTFIFTFGSLVISMFIALLLISLKAEWGTIVNELCLFKFLSVSLIALFINSFINFLLLIYKSQ